MGRTLDQFADPAPTTSSWARTRSLWPDGPRVSALGLGTWALGGPSSAGDQPLGWGSRWDADEARRVVRAASDAGITLFDTADAYGAGTAERVLGDALGPLTGSRRDEVTIVSKWGNTIDEGSRQLTGQDPSPSYVRQALRASLDRLGTGHLDLYLLHLSGLDADRAAVLLGTLEDLVHEGLVRGYGWSTDDPGLAGSWVGQAEVRAMEFEVNVVHDAAEMIDLCQTAGLSGLVRGPLGHGLLTGAHPRGSRIEDLQDFRRRSPDWLTYFSDGRPDDELAMRAEAVQDVLRSDGRTLVQGALAWLWGRSEVLLPVPGARTVAQMQENAAALDKGPLTHEQMSEVAELLSESPKTTAYEPGQLP